MLRAGISRATITPPVGMTMAGYAGREGVANGVDSDLTATALVLDDEKRKVVIIGLDLIFVVTPLNTALRESVAERLGILSSQVLLNCSHTHCGPTLCDFHYDDDPEQDRLRQAYAERLSFVIPELASEAAARLVAARIGTSVGDARIGINRREVDMDGSVMLGRNGDGPVDHEVRVVRIDDLSGKPMAVVFAHGCHTVTMGPKCLKWSSDYVGPARDLIEKTLGCLSVFLQANAGDINPICGIGTAEDDCSEKNRIGWILGGEVLQVHSSIYTESRPGPRAFFGTLSKASIYPRIKLEGGQEGDIQAVEEELWLPLQRLPGRCEAAEILEQCEADLKALLLEKAPEARLNVARRYRHWARALHEAASRGEEAVLKGSVQGIRVGDLGIVAFPGETFAALGTQVKNRSPISNSLLLGYSNGCLCYIPTRDAFPKEGWSVHKRYHVPDMLFPAYAVPTALTPDAGERVVEKSLKILAELKGMRS
ncbi:MAG: neutral/alkaline non-lysosomal ceramidase N-terminal domain-containing protein [Acidobacteriota bacterium]